MKTAVLYFLIGCKKIQMLTSSFTFSMCLRSTLPLRCLYGWLVIEVGRNSIGKLTETCGHDIADATRGVTLCTP